MVGFVGLCLLVGASSAAINAGSVGGWYLTLTPPPGNPPNWLFPPVWTVLYLLVGVSAWLVWRHVGEGDVRAYGALRLWGWQLGIGALWTPAFFGLHSPGLALLVILALVAAIALTLRAFARVERRAALLLLPYLAWVVFATYLNAGFWWLNRV